MNCSSLPPFYQYVIPTDVTCQVHDKQDTNGTTCRSHNAI